MELIYLYLLPVTVALAWMLVFIAAGRYKQINDRLLIAFLAVGGLTIFITQRMILNGYQDCLYAVYTCLAMLLELSICPLLYLYIRSVAKDARWHNRYLWLFAPAVFFCVAGSFVSVGKMEGLTLQTGLDIYYGAIEAMTVVLMAISIYDLVKYQKHSENFFANLEDSSSDKMRNILVSAIMLLLSMFLFSCLIPDVSGEDVEVLIFRSLWFTAMLWLIASNAYKIVLTEKQLDVLSIENDTSTGSATDDDTSTPFYKSFDNAQQPLRNQSSATDDDELAQKIADWQRQSDKPYCKEGITLVEVARQIDASPRVLSEYINNTMGMNFNRWINTQRIEEAKRLLRQFPEYKLGHVSNLCGYATQSAFTRTFRQIVGQSPQNFREQQGRDTGI